jgi:hypothetical protein
MGLGASLRQASRDGSPDNLPSEETTREKPQDLTTSKQEVKKAERPTLQGARVGAGLLHWRKTELLALQNEATANCSQ